MKLIKLTNIFCDDIENNLYININKIVYIEDARAGETCYIVTEDDRKFHIKGNKDDVAHKIMKFSQNIE